MSLLSRTPSDGLFYAAPELRAEAHVPSFQHYQQMYRDSLQDPTEFWGAIAKDFYWQKKHLGPFLKYNFDVTKGDIFVEWMKGATTNICYNALDRNVHEKKLGDKIAFYCRSAWTHGDSERRPGPHNGKLYMTATATANGRQGQCHPTQPAPTVASTSSCCLSKLKRAATGGGCTARAPMPVLQAFWQRKLSSNL